MTSIKKYYDDVLRGDYTKLYQRHEKFPEIVMTCAIDDDRYDVIEELLKHNVAVEWKPLFKFKWIRDKNSLLGITPENLETPEELVRKFKMVDFLISKGILDDSVIPKYVIGDWREYKGIKSATEGNRVIYFILILVSLLSAMCLSLVF